MKAPIMYSPMMGIGASISLYTETPAVTIEDFMFEQVASGEVAPLSSPKDNHDAWDLDGTDFTPEAAPDDEGFWDDFGNVVLNGDYEEIGSELVTNGGFDVDANWSFIGTGSISNGIGVFPDTTNSFIIQSNIVPASVKTYKLVYEVTKTNEGTLLLAGGSSAFGTVSLTNTVGTHTKFVTSNGTQRNLQFGSNGSFVGAIDNISLKQIDPNDRWQLSSSGNSSSSITDKLTINVDNGDFASARQALSLSNGNTYELSFDLTSDNSSKSIAIRDDDGAAGGLTQTISLNFTGTQTKSFIFTANANSDAFFTKRQTASGTYTYSIDNVSLKEYAITPLDV